jgi:hypothetical protein
VDIAEREARRFAIPEDEQPAAAVSLSLRPRRLRDCTNPRLEWGLALSTLAAFLWLLRDYFAAPDHRDLRYVFSFPILYLYVQMGLLFVKRVIVAWRTPVPRTQTAEHMRVREETRKYYQSRRKAPILQGGDIRPVKTGSFVAQSIPCLATRQRRSDRC